MKNIPALYRKPTEALQCEINWLTTKQAWWKEYYKLIKNSRGRRVIMANKNLTLKGSPSQPNPTFLTWIHKPYHSLHWKWSTFSQKKKQLPLNSPKTLEPIVPIAKTATMLNRLSARELHFTWNHILCLKAQPSNPTHTISQLKKPHATGDPSRIEANHSYWVPFTPFPKMWTNWASKASYHKT